MNWWSAATVAIIVSAVGGCSTAQSRGSITGRMQLGGGPSDYRGGYFPVSGDVRLTDDHGKMFTTTADDTGEFTIDVPSGSYSVSGYSPQFQDGSVACGTQDVTVSAKATSSINLECSMR